MYNFIKPIDDLVEKFRNLPGVGYKSAVRMAFAVVDMEKEEAESFANAIINAKSNTKYCKVCQNISDKDICDICSSESRNKRIICVVENTKDVMSIEKIHEYNGLYHIIGGLISPSDGIGPEKLKIKELLSRLNEDVEEIIIATNPSIEGEATAMYLSRLIKPLGIKVTRLASGLPAGGELEYADDLTLARAIEGRTEF